MVSLHITEQPLQFCTNIPQDGDISICSDDVILLIFVIQKSIAERIEREKGVAVRNAVVLKKP